MEVDKNSTDHLGNEFEIRVSKLYPGLLQIVCTNKNINMPKEIEGHFTGKDKAMQALHKYLSNSWEWSNEQKASRRPVEQPKPEPEVEAKPEEKKRGFFR
jgi:hypothetical protein